MSNIQAKKSGGGGDRAKWSEPEEKTLIDTLIAEVRRGRRAESGFKASSFVLVQEEIQQRHNTILEIQQIKNKYSAVSSFRCPFKEITQLTILIDEERLRYLQYITETKRIWLG